jgi:hypothetical protein
MHGKLGFILRVRTFGAKAGVYRFRNQEGRQRRYVVGPSPGVGPSPRDAWCSLWPQMWQQGRITAHLKTSSIPLLRGDPHSYSDIAAVRVFLLYGIDPLKAVPLEDFRTTSALHKVRWPQIVADVGEKRESLRKLSSRSTRSAK